MKENEGYDRHLLKISIIGNSDELNTKWLRNYFEGKLIYPINQDRKHTTLGVNMSLTEMDVENNYIKLQLWDISSKGFKFAKIHFYGSLAGIFTFDKCARDSFKVVKDWYDGFKKQNPRLNIPIAIVGFLNESEEITTEEGQDLADELNASYYETKLTDTTMTERIFRELTIQIIRILETVNPI